VEIHASCSSRHFSGQIRSRRLQYREKFIGLTVIGFQAREDETAQTLL
jgi:hypothetical protein